MKIYIAHPTNLDYQNDIYQPLKSDPFFGQYGLVFPHETTTDIQSTRDDYKNVDLVIAECSQPSTGMGIELGWFFDDDKPIFCFYRNGTAPSAAIATIAKEIIVCSNTQDFVNKVKIAIKSVL